MATKPPYEMLQWIIKLQFEHIVVSRSFTNNHISFQWYHYLSASVIRLFEDILPSY